MITYTDSVSGVTSQDLQGFFEGWPNPPSPQTHLELLQRSDHVVLAVDGETGKVVGFATAISDGVLSAYIPFVEAHPAYQGQGIGKELISQMLGQLSDLYMIDLLCDPELRPFYQLKKEIADVFVLLAAPAGCGGTMRSWPSETRKLGANCSSG